ncbi:MAG: dihydroorotate dehydrogenase [Phycisphaerales bacterium]
MTHTHGHSPLATDLAGVPLRNPVILAAGCAGTLDELAEALDLSRVGALVTKSITPLPREGNAPWRVAPVSAGMLNAVGLANPGIEAFVRDYAPRIPAMPLPIFVSVAGFSVDDYVQVCAAIDALNLTREVVPAVELNVSCPNVKAGCEFAYDPALLSDLTRETRRVLTRTRLFVKLSPIPTGRTSMTDIARAACEPANSTPHGPNQRPGADGICVANTTPAMGIDVHSRKPLLGRVTGGFSGPGVHPMAVKLVHDVARNYARAAGVPVIGIGGVLKWEDAAEFILAGATAIEMGTALYIDPRSPLGVVKGLHKWVLQQRETSISRLVGQIDLPPNHQ